MCRPRTILIAAATVAMALSSLGPPAVAAADPEVVVVHGFPGVNRIDICVDNVELKSRLKYAKSFKFTTSIGEHKVVAKKAAPGRCNGRTLGKFKEPVGVDASITLALAKVGGGSGFLSFKNNVEAPAAVAGDSSPLVTQNAAKAGKPHVFISRFGVTSAMASPNVILGKGEQWAFFANPGFYGVWGSKAGKIKPLIGPSAKSVVPGKRRHFVFVGTRPKNYAIASFQTFFPEI